MDVAAHVGVSVATVSHLLTSEQQRILCLGGAPEVNTVEQRRAGFLDALRAHGVDYVPELDRPGQYTRNSGYQRIQAALAAGLDFTAVFAGSDMVAIGVLTALREAGKDVPGDVSVVGFDDIPLASDLWPALTTVRVPYEDMGRTAVRLALAHESGDGDDHVVLSTQLVIRDSVKKAG
jgi:LacI family transcriptional regulator